MKKLSEMTLEELWELFPIKLVDYDPSWKNQFEDEKNKLMKCFKTNIPLRIEHIGSTAIPHIKAKAIIDILLETKKEDFLSFKDAIIKCGYIMMNQSENRISFNKGYTEKGYADRVFHLHLRKENDCDEIYFRNHLIKHEDDAKMYETLKIELSKRYKHDRDEYTRQKTECVKKLTQKGKIEHKLNILKQIANLFNKENITWNLGASSMLYLRGIVDDFSDIDLLVAKNDIEQANQIIGKLGTIKPQQKHKTYRTDYFYEYVIDDVEIDLISGFKILRAQKLYDLSFDEKEVFDSYDLDDIVIYMESIYKWLKFYEIMDRKDKVKLINDYIERSVL